VLLLPTEQQWRDATAQNINLNAILCALRDSTPLRRADLRTNGYFHPFAAKQLVVEDGIVYNYGRSKHLNTRSLQLRVVQESLRRTVFAACHVSPFAGHSGRDRTMYQIQARFWWPSMTRDIATEVSACGHCMLGNYTSHESQAILQTQEASNEPFDIIFLDVWSPSDGFLSKDGKLKSVTMTDCLTGFTDLAFTNENNGFFNAKAIAELVLQNFFVRRGIPRMVVHSQRRRPVCQRVPSHVPSPTYSLRSGIKGEP